MSNTAHRAKIEKQAQVTIYFGTKSAQTVLSWKGNPHRAIESLALQIGREIDHWHFN
jgi:hypothetical protein